MVNSKDVTSSKTVVNLVTEGEGDMSVRRLETDWTKCRFLREHVADFEWRKPINVNRL